MVAQGLLVIYTFTMDPTTHLVGPRNQVNVSQMNHAL